MIFSPLNDFIYDFFPREGGGVICTFQENCQKKAKMMLHLNGALAKCTLLYSFLSSHSLGFLY